MKYIIFSRVSTKQQDVENQMKECLDYVARHKKEGDGVICFREHETSSRTPRDKRPVLQKMLATVSRGDVVVVYKLDRLARKGSDLINIYTESLIDKGVQVVSLREPYVTDMLIHVFAIVAQQERENTRVRTISGLKAKQSRMEKVGTCWYGYKTDETKLQTHKEGCHSYGKPYLLIPEDSEQKQLKLMLELRNQGYSYGDIASELEKEGFVNRGGNPVGKSTVYRVLKRLMTRSPIPMEI